MPAELGPRWASLPLGVHDDVVTAVAGVARRLFGGQEDVPAAVEWLLDEPVPVEADETTREFVDELMELVDNADQLDSHPDHDTAALIPFMASLAREEALPAGVRLSVLGRLLEYAVLGDKSTVSAADRLFAQGGTLDTRYVDEVRDAVVHEVPRLLDRWDRENAPARFLLAALATACPALAADRVLPRLRHIPAPEGSARADLIALTAALFATDLQAVDHVLKRVAKWNLALTQDLSSPHAPIAEAARAALASSAIKDVRDAIIP
ncbi:hypothetical protein [Micromonospora sp. NPDC004704]